MVFLGLWLFDPSPSLVEREIRCLALIAEGSAATSASPTTSWQLPTLRGSTATFCRPDTTAASLWSGCPSASTGTSTDISGSSGSSSWCLSWDATRCHAWDATRCHAWDATRCHAWHGPRARTWRACTWCGDTHWAQQLGRRWPAGATKEEAGGNETSSGGLGFDAFYASVILCWKEIGRVRQVRSMSYPLFHVVPLFFLQAGTDCRERAAKEGRGGESKATGSANWGPHCQPNACGWPDGAAGPRNVAASSSHGQ